jgi:hypothetical protein
MIFVQLFHGPPNMSSACLFCSADRHRHTHTRWLGRKKKEKEKEKKGGAKQEQNQSKNSISYMNDQQTFTRLFTLNSHNPTPSQSPHHINQNNYVGAPSPSAATSLVFLLWWRWATLHLLFHHLNVLRHDFTFVHHLADMATPHAHPQRHNKQKI